MNNNALIEVALGASRIALPLREVDRIVRAVAIAPVPGAGACLLGVIDVAGEMVPVYDMRRLLGLGSHALKSSDRLLLTRAPARCAFLVDDVLGIVEPQHLQLSDLFDVQAAGLRGVARTSDGVLLVHDLTRLLALQRAIPVAAHA